MAKRFNDTIVVYKPKSTAPFFIWKGKRYDVSKILHHWRQAAYWWKDHGGENEYFQVMASQHLSDQDGTYELCYRSKDRAWLLTKVFD